MDGTLKEPLDLLEYSEFNGPVYGYSSSINYLTRELINNKDNSITGSPFSLCEEVLMFLETFSVVYE